jgi:hypothetical protein
MFIEIGKKNKMIAQIDEIDKDISQYNWYICKPQPNKSKTHVYYATCKSKTNERNANGKLRTIYMHRLILEKMIGRKLQRTEQVDHINHDGMDNRRINLRLATHTENLQNQQIRKYDKKTSKYKGVSWNSEKRKWSADIKINKKSIHIGRFVNEEDAANAYDLKAKEYFKTFSNTNIKEMK